MPPLPPLLTIVTTCKDSLSDLRRTYLSLLHQSPSFHSLISYIIVTPIDRSSSLHIIANSPFPCSIIADDKLGVYSAMNAAIYAAHTEYILFVNSGDTLIPNLDQSVIECMIPLLVESRYDCLFLSTLYDSSNISSSKRPRTLVKPSPHLLPRSTQPHMSSVLRLDTLIMKGGYNTAYKYIADRDYLVRLHIANASFKYLPEHTLAVHYPTSNSLSASAGALIEDIKYSYKALGLLPPITTILELIKRLLFKIT